MAKRLANKRKWVGEVLQIKNTIDDEDRPITTYESLRKVYYASIGITSEEKYLSAQNNREVIKRIEIKMDQKINEVDNRVLINGIIFMITRIWVDERNRRMELSLTHVD